MTNKTLLIVESPTKAKTISKFLGKKYTVKATMGHVRDLPKSQLGVDTENNFTPKYITIRGKGETLKELRSLVKKADKVLLGTDPDREGEAISWHLQQFLNIDADKKCRIEFHEITKDALQEAVSSPRLINHDMVDAQQARRVLDRLVGYKLSPLLWKKVTKGLSAGRVQSVALKLICDREEEINQFQPEEYWSLTGFFSALTATAADKEIIEAKLMKKNGKAIYINNQKQMEQIIAEIKETVPEVINIGRKEKKRQPVPPFITSTLQQEAYKRLNYTARKTMLIIQQLYEGIDLGKEGTRGLISYVRTDSTRVSESAKAEAREFILEQFGEEFAHAGSGRKSESKAKVQNAHEAIRPTSVYLQPDVIKSYLTNDQYKVYKLIWTRFVASRMSPMVFDTTTVDIKTGEYQFRASGSIVKFPGYMKVYQTYSDDDKKLFSDNKLLPPVTVGQMLQTEQLEPKQHFTQPPPRYADASLIKALEDKGIGRPSTYAPIVDTILKRGYIIRENKQFYPTELGLMIIELLREHFPDIIDVEFTADLEKKLDNIADGSVEWVDIIRQFYAPFADALEKAEQQIGEIKIQEQVSDEVCENCGRNLVVKMGRFGKFLACPGFPDCRYTKALLEQTGVKCSQCGGELVLRRSKKGRSFYGCSNYPDCKFVCWNKPTNYKCPQCGAMLMETIGKNRVIIYKCSNEDCEYKRQADSEEQGDNI